MIVTRTIQISENFEELDFAAVCKSDGYPSGGVDENNTFALYTPSAVLRMNITNPALVGIAEGETTGAGLSTKVCK